jgi:hypothetical protein
MNRFAARSFASFAAIVGGSLVVACGSAPDETTSQTASDLYARCPYGQYRDCESDEGPRGPIFVCGACMADDNVYSITDLALAPGEATNPDGAYIEVSPDPTKYGYPPELAGMGCSHTAVYHRYGAAVGGSNGPDPGARIWICATSQLSTPWEIAPTQSLKYDQVIASGTHFDSAVLGSAKPGWTIVAEKLYTACGNPCIINHGCSGSCGAGPTP